MFDWIGANWIWCLLGFVVLFVLLSVVGYFSVRAKAERTLQKDGLLEALRMLNSGSMDSEITKLLDAQLPRWSVTDELKSAVAELQHLKVGLDAAARAGLSQGLIAAFKQDTLKALEQMWQLAERVAGAQNVEHTASYIEPVKRVCEAAKEARLTLTQLMLTDREASGEKLQDAEANLRGLREATKSLERDAQ